MNCLKDIDRFYYRHGEGIYRLERAGQIVQVVNPPGLIESPEFVLYVTLDTERTTAVTWHAVGIDLENNYGWIFERSATPDDDTEPLYIDLERDADAITEVQAAHDWIAGRFQPIQVDDVVEMHWRGGTYSGRVLRVDSLNCRVKVEYQHPTRKGYWHGWRDFAEVAVIHTAKVAA